MALSRARGVATQPERAAIYLRISDDREDTGLGVARQRKDCETHAQRLGWPIAATFTDNDKSAWSGRVRPAYREMVQAIEDGAVDAIIVWRYDRLYRKPAELEAFIDLANAHGIALATVTGKIDLGTAEGRHTARSLGNAAALESDIKSERIRNKHAQLAQQGKPSGGGRAFGYNSDWLTINAAEAKAIREGARRVLAGESLRGIARDWNERGITTVGVGPKKPGRTWYTSAIKRVLTSGRIAGMREHRDEIVGKAQWPAIITASELMRLRATLLDPERRIAVNARRYLLSGMLWCGAPLANGEPCGHRLYARPRGDKRRCYVCASGPGFEGCGKIRRLSDPVEDLVVRAVIHAVDGPGLRSVMESEARTASKDGDLVRGIAEDEEQQTDLARQWAAKRITRAEWIAARDVIDKRLTAARAQLSRERRTSALDAYIGKPGALARKWPTLSLHQQRAVISAVVDRVVLLPAVKGRNVFDPTRVKIVWRA